ncbi:MAG: VWA domain-containing protein [Dehalococcoidia bacterium]
MLLRLSLLTAILVAIAAPSLTRPPSADAADEWSCPADFRVSFLIDVSGSVPAEELQYEKAFAHGIVDALPFGIDGSVGNLIRFDSHASVLQTFTPSSPLLKNALNGLTTSGGSTNWAEALYQAAQDRSRSSVPKGNRQDVILLVTDGTPNVDHFTQTGYVTAHEYAAAARAAGVEILVIAHGAVAANVSSYATSDPVPLDPITTPANVFTTPTAPGLLDLVAPVLDRMCEAAHVLCPPGAYSDDGYAPCDPAPAGHFTSGLGATEPAVCLVGSYQPQEGQTACLAAPAGSYVTATGATQASLCPAGAYQPSEGATSCINAPPGKFVAVEGAIQASDCALGTYQPGEGQTSCLPAPLGTYVDAPGSVAPTACPAGHTTLALGSDSIGACVPVDTDNDGVDDLDDACPQSDLSATIVIDGMDTGVPNVLLEDGCSLVDLVVKAAAGSSRHGGFVSAVAALTNQWKAAGHLTGAQKGAIQRAAALSSLP